MAQVEIKATKCDNEATISYDFGDSCADACEKFGEDVVLAGFMKSSKITAQSAIRRYLDAGLDEDGIQAKMDEWKPGVALERVSDPVAAIRNKWGSLTPEQQADILSELKNS